jgi:hypothetical protein
MLNVSNVVIACARRSLSAWEWVSAFGELALKTSFRTKNESPKVLDFSIWDIASIARRAPVTAFSDCKRPMVTIGRLLTALSAVRVVPRRRLFAMLHER